MTPSVLSILFSVSIIPVLLPASTPAQDRLIVRLDGRDNGSASGSVYFGLHPDATDCIDGEIEPGLVEEEIPVPPSGVFEMRFMTPSNNTAECLGWGTHVDIRGYESCGLDTFRLNFQPGSTGYPFCLAWNRDSMLAFDSAIMRDLFGGFLLNVDMREDSAVCIGNPAISSVSIVTGFVCTGIGGIPLRLPSRYSIGPNFPNPFNSSTSIIYSVASPADVVIEITDVLGRVVAVLGEGRQPAGEHATNWRADGLPSGVYYYRLTAPETNPKSGTMLLLR